MNSIVLPDIALSVRQPWAWAIVSGNKDIENRTTFAVTKAKFDVRPVSIHAAKGMTRNEYETAADFMASLGIHCPRPDALVRGAIIGKANIVAIVKYHTSPWFFGPRGLVLADTFQVKPIPAVGALGYFPWKQSGEVSEPLPWMIAWPEGRGAANKPINAHQNHSRRLSETDAKYLAWKERRSQDEEAK